MNEKLFKVIVLGNPTVGKTSFVQRFVQDTFRRDYKGTVGVDFALKIIKWSESQVVKLQLWDIAGLFVKKKKKANITGLEMKASKFQVRRGSLGCPACTTRTALAA